MMFLFDPNGDGDLPYVQEWGTPYLSIRPFVLLYPGAVCLNQ